MHIKNIIHTSYIDIHTLSTPSPPIPIINPNKTNLLKYLNFIKITFFYLFKSISLKVRNFKNYNLHQFMNITK